MKILSVSRGIVPLGKFKAGAGRFLRDLADSSEPLVITQHGRPAAVVLSPKEFDRLRERHRFLESVAAGLADADAGRLMSTAELRRRLSTHRSARGKRSFATDR